MNKSALSLTIFIGMSLVVAFLVHNKIKKIIFACIVASVISSITYQLLGIIVVGYLDPFIIPAFLTSLGVSFAIAVIASIPFTYSRFKAERKLNNTDSENKKRDG